MASLSEVQVSLQNLLDSSVYPLGESFPSVAGGTKDIFIGIGWPQPGLLERVLPQNKSVISIFTPPHQERNVTRFFPVWQDKEINVSNLILSVVDNKITITGMPTVGEIPVIIVNNDNLNTYSYTVAELDTVDTIAFALAQIIPGSVAVDNTITISNVIDLQARVSTKGTRIIEHKRQERIFWLIVWAHTPTLRNLICDAVDISIAKATYINLPNDIEQARLIYKDMCEYDFLVKQQCYRRDFYVHVEYPTTVIDTDYTLAAIHTPITNTSI